MKKEYIDFTPIKEDYSIYELENGQRLKFRQYVSTIVKNPDLPKKDGKEAADFGMKTDSYVETPIEIDTSELEEADKNNVTQDDVVKELKFKIIKEPVNIYETEKSIILIISKTTKVYLTNKKDKTGNPIIRFTSTIAFTTMEKPIN